MENDIRPYYQLMNELKKYVDQLPKPKRQPSDKTKYQYRCDVKSMDDRQLEPSSIAKTKNTYYKYRAAWIFCYKEAFYELHKEINSTQDKNQKIFLIQQLELIAEQIKKYPPDPKGEKFKEIKSLIESGVDVDDIEKTGWRAIKGEIDDIKNHSKKYQRLPKNWNERYFKHVSSKNSKYTKAIAFLAISGCRPAELENGVSLGLREDGSIKLCIESIKTHDGDYGQKTRKFTVKSDSSEYQYLVDLMKKNDDQIWIQIESAKKLGEQMRKYSKKVFPRMKSFISPYTYRHQFARQVKTTLIDKVDVAVALGHSNDKSQRFYANASKNAGGMQIKELEGTREVKQISQASEIVSPDLFNKPGSSNLMDL